MAKEIEERLQGRVTLLLVFPLWKDQIVGLSVQSTASGCAEWEFFRQHSYLALITNRTSRPTKLRTNLFRPAGFKPYSRLSSFLGLFSFELPSQSLETISATWFYLNLSNIWCLCSDFLWIFFFSGILTWIQSKMMEGILDFVLYFCHTPFIYNRTVILNARRFSVLLK